MNRKMQEHQEKYGAYLRMISENEPDVVITNQRELSSKSNDHSAKMAEMRNRVSEMEVKREQLEGTVKSQGESIDHMKKHIQSL